MLKKLFAFIGVSFCFVISSAAFAQQSGQVILDLQDDKEFEYKNSDLGFDDVINFGIGYFQDVKEYNDLLQGDNIKKDFTADIMAKYPHFTEDSAKRWQKHVKSGVRLYRWFDTWKNKAVSWIMERELPLVVADDQYEMGESEEYIESDEPVVIHDFKKVVAYSNSERDRVAAEEKYAKDNNLPRPSEIIKRYKKALIEKNWSELLGIDWENIVASLTQQEGTEADGAIDRVTGVVLTQQDGADVDGKIYGVILLEPVKNTLVLLDKYDEYKGLEVNFSESENLQNVRVSFVLPQLIRINKYQEIKAYLTKFPIYFSAEAVDVSKPIIISPVINGSVCRENTCVEMQINPKTVLSVKNDVKNTPFATYVKTVSMNIPKDSNADNFDFGHLVLERGNAGKSDNLRLEVQTDDAALLKIFLIGEEAKYFGKAKLRIDNDKVVARFEQLNQMFNPLGKKVKFWVATSANNQYLYEAEVQDVSILDIESGKVSLGILGLAFIGGLLLNLMPCVFPVLSLKLLAFTKFGGLNVKQIRKNFLYNSLGIMVSFVIMAILLAVLKLVGHVLGWGMQFQNIYFLGVMIWVVVLFLAYVFGFLSFRFPQYIGKAKYGSNGLFEFLSGVFLVVLSTPCMAPYLGTAFGVALAGSIADILMVVCVVGLGLASPYIVITIYPKIAFYMPKPGKWLETINILMVLMLVVTIGWLISIMAAQSSGAQIWHWLLYIVVALFILGFRKTLMSEIDKLERSDFAAILRKRFNLIFVIVVGSLFVISMIDVGNSVAKKRDEIGQTKITELDLLKIDEIVDAGQKVLVKVGADWCLTCKYNDVFVFDVEHITDALANYNVKVIDIDWTNYQPSVLNFMQKFGRRGLPFYVLFSPAYPDGVVLPEIVDINDLQTMIEM